MENSLIMDIIKRFSDWSEKPNRCFDAKRFSNIFERSSLDEFHDKISVPVMLTVVHNFDDIRMIQFG